MIGIKGRPKIYKSQLSQTTCATANVLQTKVDAQSGKLATIELS